MDSDAKPPKTLIRSVMDAFRGRTPEDGLDLDVDAEGQEPGLGRMLREDSPNEELVRAAAASETERSSGVSPNGRIGLGEMRYPATTASERSPGQWTELQTQHRGFDQSATDPRLFPRNGSMINGLPTVLPHAPATVFRSTHQNPSWGMEERGMVSSSVPNSYQLKGDFSVRKGLGDAQNVTVRESRRPTERPKDREYRRLTISSANGMSLPLQTGIQGHARMGQPTHSPVPSVPSPGMTHGSGPSYGIEPFMITLIYNGQPTRHEVYDAMPIFTLMEDAGQIFGLDPNHLLLTLFSAVPATLDRYGVVAGPPRLVENATVFVFVVHAPIPTSQERVFPPSSPAPYGFGAPAVLSANAMVSSKLLGSFKLPKFDLGSVPTAVFGTAST